MITRWPRRSTASTRSKSFHRRGPWRSFEAVEFATLDWVDWFNNRRLLEPIGNIPPAEAEELRYAMRNNQPWRRDSNETASDKPGALHDGLAERYRSKVAAVSTTPIMKIPTHEKSITSLKAELIVAPHWIPRYMSNALRYRGKNMAAAAENGVKVRYRTKIRHRRLKDAPAGGRFRTSPPPPILNVRPPCCAT
jgi:hypothetical protein